MTENKWKKPWKVQQKRDPSLKIDRHEIDINYLLTKSVIGAAKIVQEND